MRPYSCMAVSTRFFVTTKPFRASTRSVISCGGGRQLDLFSNLCRLRTPRARLPSQSSASLRPESPGQNHQVGAKCAPPSACPLRKSRRPFSYE